MKKTQKITFSAVFAALAVVLLLGGYFPYLTYAIPAVAGLFIMVVFIEVGAGYALGAYAVSSVLALLLCEKEVAALYIVLFGFYPMLKSFIERIKNIVVEWVLKMLCFNASIGLAYLLTAFIFDISYSDLEKFGKIGIIGFAVLCNIVFVLYDIAVERMAAFYLAKFHSKFQKFVK